MRPVEDAQVRRLMEEMNKLGEVGLSAAKAGMDRKTARKYLACGEPPSRLKRPRDWRTRQDPLGGVWEERVVPRLKDAPELEAKALFEDLVERWPGELEPDQLRTFQRRVRDWRAQEGPPKEVYFTQEHRPGEAMQTDFTWGTKLAITIGGEPYVHMLCHAVLPYSNWEWATVCLSESMLALKRGVQQAVFRLGRVPEWHQTDNSTAATHQVSQEGERRPFNREYEAIMAHLGMKPRTIMIGEKHQNGDVESSNGALKRRLEQHLLLRGTRDFEGVEAYERWVQSVVEKANGLRERKVSEELAVMKPLGVRQLPEYTTIHVPVSKGSLIKVKKNTYSVPSRLIGEEVEVRIYEERLEVLHKGKYQLTLDRLLGEGRRRINYRHLITSLVRKPGAFRNYRYREELFPTLTFRRVYDALVGVESQREADLDYLRILQLAATTMEAEVEVALEILLEEGVLPRFEDARELLASDRPEVPEIAAPEVVLDGYDDLLEALKVAS